MKDNEKKLFLPRVTQQHSSVIIENARTLCNKLAKMHEKLPSLGNKPDRKGTLKYFSKLYNECVPIVVSITLFAVQNKLTERKKVYDNLKRAQDILGYLKVLDLRYQLISTSPRFTKKPATWYNNSKLENSKIIEKLKELVDL